MVRWTSEVCVEQFATPRRRTAVRCLNRHKHGIDMLKNAWIADFQYPTIGRCIIHTE